MAPQAAGDTGRVPELLVEPSFSLPWPPSVPTALLGHPSPLRCRLTAQPSRTQPLLPGAGLPSRERRLQQEPYGAGLQRGGKPDGKPEISPAEPQPHRGPRAALASHDSGGRTPGAALQGAGDDAQWMPGAPTLWGRGVLPSPPACYGFERGCPGQEQMAAAAGWPGGLRWCQLMAPTTSPGCVPPGPAPATGGAQELGPGTPPEREQGRLLPAPC